MGGNNRPVDPRKVPVVYKPKPGVRDLDYHSAEWTSGQRGGGSVPADFHWRTNPKQHQEERGAPNAPVPPAAKK